MTTVTREIVAAAGGPSTTTSAVAISTAVVDDPTTIPARISAVRNSRTDTVVEVAAVCLLPSCRPPRRPSLVVFCDPKNDEKKKKNRRKSPVGVYFIKDE